MSANTASLIAISAVQLFKSVFALTFEAQLIVGSSVSFTVTVKLQFAFAPATSVISNVLVVIPLGYALPDAKPAVCNTENPVQLSTLTGAE